MFRLPPFALLRALAVPIALEFLLVAFFGGAVSSTVEFHQRKNGIVRHVRVCVCVKKRQIK